MLRAYPRIIALSAMVVALSTAQAAEPETLTLACKGTETQRGGAGKVSEQIEIGIIVDFQKRMVFVTIPSPSVASTKRGSLSTPCFLDGL